MKLIDRWFWAICVLAALLGLFLPQLGMPLAKSFKFLLGTILFFSGLRLDFRAAWREVKRPWLVFYASLVILVIVPVAMYTLALQLLPVTLAFGVLIVASMPAGTACSALTDIVKGNAALALVVTLMTSLLCPIVTPWIISVSSGTAASGGLSFLAEQAIFLAIILFVPLGLALFVRRMLPTFTQRHRETFSALSMISLFLLILGAMASVSSDFMTLVEQQPALAVGLFMFVAFLSASRHVIGYFLAPWRALGDRAALSVNLAYVNNGLAIVFASEFYKPIPELGAHAVLPAIFLEIPMALMLVPLKSWVARCRRHDEAPDASPGVVSADCT